MKKNYLAIVILIGSFIIGVSLILSSLINNTMGKRDESNSPRKIYENITYVKVDDSPTMGDPGAPVTIVEYTDFDCPICRAVFDEILPSLKRDFINTGKVKFVFKSLPLEYHITAFKKTEAAFCAREQAGDKGFFAYYDGLFQKFNNINPLSLNDELILIAQENKLDKTVFLNCLGSGKYAGRIRDEIVEAKVIGSLGTPTWLIGKSSKEGISETVKMSGLLEYEVYRTIINNLLK